MHEDRAGLSFAAGDDVDCPVLIEIDEQGIFRGPHMSHRYGGPGFLHGCGAGMEVRSNNSSFLPAGGDVGKSILVAVCQANSVGTA